MDIEELISALPESLRDLALKQIKESLNESRQKASEIIDGHFLNLLTALDIAGVRKQIAIHEIASLAIFTIISSMMHAKLPDSEIKELLNSIFDTQLTAAKEYRDAAENR